MPYIADSQICVNAARDKVVPCDSPEARYNLALPGWEVADEVAEQYGLSSATPAPVEDEPAPEKKAVSAAPANKAVAASSNKSGAKK